MKRTSELYERAINSKKRSHCHLFQRRMQERLQLLLKILGSRITKVGTTKDIFLHIRGAYLHAFQTFGQIGHTCVGRQKLRWPRAPRSLNPSLTVVTSVPYSITFASRCKKLLCHRSVDCKKFVYLDFYVAAFCNLGCTICGSYMEQVWPTLECPFKVVQLRFDQPS